MSGTLDIAFAGDMPTAAVEVVGPDLATVERVWLGPGQQKSVEVPSEASFLRIHLASGEIVTLHDAGNLKRTISGATLKDRLARGRGDLSRPKSVADLRRFRSSSPVSQSFPLPDMLTFEGGVVVRFVSPEGSAPQCQFREPGIEVVLRPTQASTPHELQVEYMGMRTRVRLPGTVDELSVRSDEIADGRRIVTVRVNTSSHIADAIGAYLNRGDLHSAAAMTDWAEKAESLLMDKRQDPFAAAVGAYLLLRLRRFDLMRDWARNLAKWFPDLADGHVIWASQQLHQRGNESEIRASFERAQSLPLPVFTEGLQLLVDGVRLLGTDDDRAMTALNKRVGIALWKSPFTSTLQGLKTDRSSLDVDVDYAPSL